MMATSDVCVLLLVAASTSIGMRCLASVTLRALDLPTMMATSCVVAPAYELREVMRLHDATTKANRTHNPSGVSLRRR
jgi:hypothetical protein